jgi:UDP-glucose 4-epimerase
VISIFCARMAAGQGVTIHGDGGQTRDFVYVNDVIAALLAGMRVADTAAPVLNVCSGHATSITGLAALINDLCGGTALPTFVPARAGDIRHSRGCPARATARLGASPQTSLRAGLSEVLAWMRSGSPGLAVEHSVAQ